MLFVGGGGRGGGRQVAPARCVDQTPRLPRRDTRLGFAGGMVPRCQVRMGKPSGLVSVLAFSLHGPGPARPDPGDRHRRGRPSRLRRLCSGLPNERQVHSANACSAGDGLEDQLVSKSPLIFALASQIVRF